MQLGYCKGFFPLLFSYHCIFTITYILSSCWLCFVCDQMVNIVLQPSPHVPASGEGL